MSFRVSISALTWSVGVTSGVAVGVLVGPFVPDWGMSIGVPAVAAMFAALVTRDPRDEACAAALRSIGAVTLGFVITTIPITLRDVEPAPQLLASWVGTALGVPIAIAALAKRVHR